ncbi:PREDICTED: putative cyclin-B3-1 isoform X2 [Lupinus angustifolius]|uniref:putative cyclin-B3-1 isoform X2 n=1 Tax=Lupinus angustifolius TaxID=3871 RepID=UPI00092EDAE6|nr:PREDICTED: putative cyclin-B3-1 isoform X2 [Lupinus angustifolius]
MVSLKGKSKVAPTRVSEVALSRTTVDGTRTCKVYSENECVKASDRLIRNVLVANKGVIPSCASNAKGGPKTMEKRTVKYGTSANVNVRKALADVSNVQQNSSTNIRCDGSRIKVSTGSSTKIVSVSLRKSFTGRVQRKSDVQLDTSKKGTDSRAYLGHQKNDTDVAQSVVTTKERFVRKHVLATRKSLPVPRRVSRADISSTKENDRSSETAKGQSALPTKATEGRRVSSQLVNSRSQLVNSRSQLVNSRSQPVIARSHLWKNRVSDGFVQMVQTNALHTSSRKSTKPLIRTALNASTSQRTLKTTSISGLKKSQSTAAMSAHDELTASSSLPENGSVIVSDDTNQVHLPSNDESNHKTDLSFIPRKKSSRRKSYTTSIIERSKFLKESEVTEQDNLPDIDNECNQLEVSEYIDEIYQYYWVCEAHNPALTNYMSIQTDITPHMRAILINWLIEVHFKFDLMPETLYLTVTLVDQYLSQVSINKSDMQLVGLTALLLASKYEDFWHPRVKDLISISAQSYTRDQMLGMEKLILRKLKFRLNTPTPYVFMVRFLKAAQSDKKLEHMAFFLIDLCLVEYEALAFKPSLLCASALYVARCTIQITPPWTPLLHKHARYGVSQIRDCAEMILKFHKAAGLGKLAVTHEKYSRPELSGVAAVKPLDKLPL